MRSTNTASAHEGLPLVKDSWTAPDGSFVEEIVRPAAGTGQPAPGNVAPPSPQPNRTRPHIPRPSLAKTIGAGILLLSPGIVWNTANLGLDQTILANDSEYTYSPNIPKDIKNTFEASTRTWHDVIAIPLGIIKKKAGD